MKSLKQYPIGFWNYTDIPFIDESRVQEWRELGITAPMGPNFPDTPEGRARMLKILDWCAERGMHVIVCDPRTDVGPHHAAAGSNAKEFDKRYRKAAKRAIEDFGGHPAALGFHLIDEPGSGIFESTCAAVRVMRELAPDLLAFVNLLPYGCDVGYADWDRYLDDYAQASGIELLAYDYYRQLNPPSDKDGIEGYFRNLRAFREAAQRRGITFWNTVLSVGHFHYRCPTEDDFRWQLNTTLASGAAGISYFFVYMREPHCNYRVSPVDEHGERTETFAWLSRVNRTFLRTWGELFPRLRFKGARHANRAFGGEKLYSNGMPGDRVVQINTSTLHAPDWTRSIILSDFTDERERPYLMVTNNDQRESVCVDLRVRGKELLHQVWDHKEKPVGHSDRDSVRVAGLYLAPGQAELFRIAE